jgi:hypothetical protein
MFAQFRDGAGNAREKWVPFGMPALPPVYLNSVFYLLGASKNGPIPMGSGVLVGVSGRGGVSGLHIYAVTARHVLNASNSMQINTFDGYSRPIPVNMDEWTYVEDREDLAVFDLTEEIDEKTDNISVLPYELFLKETDIGEYGINPGEEGFMVGLFSPHPGEKRNLPAPRFGCLSMLASEREPIKQEQRDLGTTLVRPAFVFEIHSRPGFSGSPVYIYRTPTTNLAQLSPDGSWNLSTYKNLFLRLLGIHVGQFREPAEVAKAEGYGPQPILDGDNAYLPSSMTIVVPAKQILELLDMKKLKDQREARDKSAKPSSMVQESAVAVPAADNPDHKEDFMRLLNAAAQAKPEASKT